VVVNLRVAENHSGVLVNRIVDSLIKMTLDTLEMCEMCFVTMVWELLKLRNWYATERRLDNRFKKTYQT